MAVLSRIGRSMQCSQIPLTRALTEARKMTLFNYQIHFFGQILMKRQSAYRSTITRPIRCNMLKSRLILSTLTSSTRTKNAYSSAIWTMTRNNSTAGYLTNAILSRVFL